MYNLLYIYFLRINFFYFILLYIITQLLYISIRVYVIFLSFDLKNSN